VKDVINLHSANGKLLSQRDEVMSRIMASVLREKDMAYTFRVFSRLIVSGNVIGINWSKNYPRLRDPNNDNDNSNDNDDRDDDNESDGVSEYILLSTCASITFHTDKGGTVFWSTTH